MSRRTRLLWIGVPAAALATAALAWGLYLARWAIVLVYISAVIATGLSPAVRAIESRPLPLAWRKPPRWAAALLIYFVALLALVVVMAAVLPPMIAQLQELIDRLPSAFDTVQEFLAARGFQSRSVSMREVLQQLPAGAVNVLGKFWTFIGAIFSTVVVAVLSFYLLTESGELFDTFIAFVPKERRARARSLAEQVVSKVGSWLIGQLILCGVIGASTGIVLGLIGVPYFYVLAVVAAVGEFVPYAGPLLAAIPGIAIALSVSWQTALAVTIFYLAQQLFENNVLVPKLMQHQVGLTASAVIIAVTIGSALLGVLGAVLAVPTTAILQIGLRELRPRD